MFGLYSVWEAVEGRQMAVPSIQRSRQLNQENELLLKKLRLARLKNKQLEGNLVKLQEELYEQKSASVQTDVHLYHKGDGIHHKERELIKENARVVQMYNNLRKRYNKEIKTNQRQNEDIATLSVKIDDLEHQLSLANQKVKELQNKKLSKEKTILLKKISSNKCMCKRKGTCSCKYLDQLLFEIQHLKMENETISKERSMLRNELAALDKDFFDEVEDLKYALQEAIKLNTQYERCLKQVSSTYGITLTSALLAGNHRIGL